MITKHELELLMENAAFALCGKRVTVRLQEPPTNNFDGEFYTVSGKPFIDVSPRFSDATTLYIFLHECGHAVLKHGVEREKSTSPHSQALTPFGVALRSTHPITRKQEEQADAYAKRWLEYASANCGGYSGGELERKLRCLSGWIKDKQHKRVEMIATAAAIKAVELYLWQKEQEQLYAEWRDKKR
jgi:hypothetical protein